MKRPFNETVVPPGGGWKYADPVTGVPVSSNSLTVMLQQVKAQRVANGVEVGSGWEHVVLDEMCEQNPGFRCVEAGAPEIHLTGDDVKRFLLTLKEQYGNDLVSDEEHRRRADICLSCPKMADVACTFPCGWVSRTLTEMLGGRKIHRPAELHKKGCSACKCNIDAKTYYPLDVLKAVDVKLGKQPDYWENCWMREAPASV
jgi:hypothetical protein